MTLPGAPTGPRRLTRRRLLSGSLTGGVTLTIVAGPAQRALANFTRSPVRLSPLQLNGLRRGSTGRRRGVRHALANGARSQNARDDVVRLLERVLD